MPIFILRPIDTNDPSWKASTISQSVVIRAPSDIVARDAAVAAFAIATEKSGCKPLLPPWRQENVVAVSMVSDVGYSTAGPIEILDPSEFNEELIHVMGEFEPHPENLMCWDRRTGCGYWFYDSDHPEQQIGLQVAKNSRPGEDPHECLQDNARVGKMTEAYRRAAIEFKRSKR